MPIVNFVRTRPAADGDVPATGYFRFRPSRPRVLDGAPDETVLPVPFKALLVGGAAAVNLAPTDVSWAWEVLESVDGIPDVTYYVTVPDVAGPLDDPDLPRVNPKTLSPRAVPEAAWWPVANATITGAAVVGDDLILTRHDGSTVNAGRVTPTQQSLDTAATAAVDAELDTAVDASVQARLGTAVDAAVGAQLPPAVTAAVGPAVTTAVASAVGPAAAAAVAAAATPGALTFLTDTDGRPYIA